MIKRILFIYFKQGPRSAHSAQGRAGVPIQGHAEDPRGCGTRGHGLVVALAGLGHCMILEVFSTHNNSMILLFPGNLMDRVGSLIAAPDDISPR